MSSTALPSEEILPPSKRAVTCRLKCAEIGPAHLTRCTRPCRATLRLFLTSEARLLVLADMPRSGPLC